MKQSSAIVFCISSWFLHIQAKKLVKEPRKRKKTATDKTAAAKTARPQPAKTAKKPATVICRYSPGKDASVEEKKTEMPSGNFLSVCLDLHYPPALHITLQHQNAPCDHPALCHHHSIIVCFLLCW